MSFNRLIGSIALSLFLSISFTESAHAQWKNIAVNAPSFDLNLSKCDYRLRYSFNNTFYGQTDYKYFYPRAGTDNAPGFRVAMDALNFQVSEGEVNAFFKEFSEGDQAYLKTLFKDIAAVRNLSFYISSSTLPRLYFLVERNWTDYGTLLPTTTAYASPNPANFVLQERCQNETAYPRLIESVTATSSTAYSPAYSANNAVDNIETTFWYSALQTSAENLTLNLNGSFVLTSLDITWMSVSAGTQISVLVSEDGTSFRSARTNLPAGIRRISLSQEKATHVRLVFSRPGASYIGIKDIAVEGIF